MTMSNREMQESIQCLADETRKRRGQAPKKLHPQTIEKLRNEAKVAIVRSQTITEARLKACSDVRMFALLWMLTTSLLQP